MNFIPNKITHLAVLIVLSTSLTVNAGEQIPKNSYVEGKTLKLKQANLSVSKNKKTTQKIVKNKLPHTSHSTANQVCAIDENGQNWQKLQKKLSRELRTTAFNKKSNKNKQQAVRQVVSGDGIAGRYYIPVVFHVYGEQFNCADSSKSCLTDEKIIDALQRLNEDFQGSNTKDGPIAAQFQAIRESLDIEFVLAKRAPTGETTTGIIRYQQEQAGYGSGGGFDTLIAADAWDNFKYMNIYLMNDLYDDGSTNNSGVAWYPDLTMSQANTARVVYNGWYVGDNTDENFRSVLTHEFGHWLNLPHTFSDNTCSLANETFCALTGDRSCDTPQMSLSTSMYDNALNCLGQATNTENFMHYTSNYAMFTQDQVNRMTAALHGDARISLWSNDNLIDTGLVALTSNAEHPWDGVSGIDNGPEGDLIASFSDLSAQKDDIDTFVVDAPAATQALAFYLSGYSQDPDMYVSAGQAPQYLGDGNWQADYISFLAAGTPEFVGVLGPKDNETFYASIHAFSDYNQANLQVLAVDDPLLAMGTKRYHVANITGLWALENTEAKTFQYTIPENAEKVVIVFAGAYGGDPDMYISKNRAVDIETADCAPFSAAKLAEYCEFSSGGTFNIMIDPFAQYWDGNLHVYYETTDTSNQPPFAITSAQYKAMINHQVYFKGDKSIDVDGSLVTYLWDFGNGDSSNEINPIYTYSTLGEYQVTLTVTDNLGQSAMSKTTASITLYNPDDEPLCEGCNRVYLTEEIDLTATKGSEPRQYKFSVPTAASLVVIEIIAGYNGDPDLHVAQNKQVSLASFTCRPFKGNGELESCQFSEGGIFNVMIDPFDTYSGVTFKAYYDIRDDADLSLPNELPIANTGGPYNAISGNELALSSELSLDEDGYIASYLWNFGDGSSSDSANPLHVYNQVGEFTLSLTIVDNEGASTTSTTTVNVTPVGDMDGDGDVDRDDIRSFSLAIRRGDILDSSFDLNNDGLINNLDVRLMRSICSYDRCSNVAPPPQAPNAVASSLTTADQFENISFSSQDSSDRYGRIVSYLWDFGDGNTSDAANPSHAYQQVGSFTVLLTVTDNDGMTATDTIEINIQYGPLINSCISQPEFSGGTLEPAEVQCLGQQTDRTFSIPEIKNHQSIAITVAHGEGDLALYYRNAGWANINTGNYDASSTEANNQACIYLELTPDLDYWSYIALSGDSSNATIVVDFDTQGCRAVVE